ncbi:hypothetical protein [Ilumatobacter sp.]|uniref:hypothetical protein n=1 Tax=Ilumatobacter sp. TaxID=1967498 RepID=UPI003B52F45C
MACLSIVYLGAVMQASTGVGVGILSSPVLLFVDPDFVPGAIVLAVIPLSLTVAVADRAHVDRPGVAARARRRGCPDSSSVRSSSQRSPTPSSHCWSRSPCCSVSSSR